MEPVRIWHLLTHTAGLTYGFHNATPVDAMYRAAGFELGSPPGRRPGRVLRHLGGPPAAPFQPGAEWNYSVATDVLGRVVEVRLGHDARPVLRRADLRAPRDGRHRLLRARRPTTTAWPSSTSRTRPATPATAAQAVPIDMLGQQAKTPPSMLGGGGGLVSTTADYHRFCRMLLGRRPARRRAPPRHPHPGLTPGRTTSPAAPTSSRSAARCSPRRPTTGSASGSASRSSLDPAKNKLLSSEGELAWGGAASTGFWVDRREDLR